MTFTNESQHPTRCDVCTSDGNVAACMTLFLATPA